MTDQPIIKANDTATDELFDFDAALRELARERQRLEARNVTAEQMSEMFYELYCQPYEDEIAANKTRLDEMEQRIRDAARAAALEDGDFHPHASIEVTRKPITWRYDDDAMLKALEQSQLTECIRARPPEIDRNALNKVLRIGAYPWLPAEQNPQEYIVKIAALGDLLITDKAEG